MAQLARQLSSQVSSWKVLNSFLKGIKFNLSVLMEEKYIPLKLLSTSTLCKDVIYSLFFSYRIAIISILSCQTIRKS